MGVVDHGPLTVAAVARRMGLRRQSVQRTADLLVADGVAAYVDNPADKRARLLTLTTSGPSRAARDRARPAARGHASSAIRRPRVAAAGRRLVGTDRRPARRTGRSAEGLIEERDEPPSGGSSTWSGSSPRTSDPREAGAWRPPASAPLAECGFAVRLTRLPPSQVDVSANRSGRRQDHADPRARLAGARARRRPVSRRTASPPSTRSTRRPAPTARPRSRSPTGSPPKTSPPRRRSPSTMALVATPRPASVDCVSSPHGRLHAPGSDPRRAARVGRGV